MANCGCNQTGCSCFFDTPEDDSISFSGSGTLSDPIVFTATNPGYVRPASKISKAAAQLQPPVTDTVVTFSTEVFDYDNMINIAGAPTRITITTAGFYLLGAQVRFQSSDATIPMYVKIKKNGTTFVSQDSESDRVSSLEIYVYTQAFESCEVGDYFQLFTSHDSGAFNYNIELMHMWAMRMGDNA